jgi:hypothetical protein
MTPVMLANGHRGHPDIAATVSARTQHSGVALYWARPIAPVGIESEDRR